MRYFLWKYISYKSKGKNVGYSDTGILTDHFWSFFSNDLDIQFKHGQADKADTKP